MRNILKPLLITTLGIFSTIILSGYLFYKSEFDMAHYGDVSMLLKQNRLDLFLGLLISIFILSVFWYIFGKLQIRSFWKKVIPLLLVSGLLQLLVIFFFRTNFTADWEVVWRIAKELMSNNLSSIQKGGYLYAYPINFGLGVYFIFLNFISLDNTYLARILNVVYSLMTIVILNKTLLALNPKYEKYSGRFLVLSVLFLPAIFISNLVYNEVISTMLFLAGVYLSVSSDRPGIKRLILIAIIFSLGNSLRSIGPLFAFSTIVYFYLMRVYWQKIAFFMVLLVIGFAAPLWLFNAIYRSAGRIVEPLGKNSVPITAWANIGLTDKYFGYWDQGESYSMYTNDANWNKKEANKLYIKGLQNKINAYQPRGIATIYYKKLVWLWTEGTYQSVYLGMSHSAPGGYREETWVSKYFEQNLKQREFFKTPMYYWNLLSLISIFLFIGYIICTRKWFLLHKEMILALILLSFIFFYLLWEVKPRYIFLVYPYLQLLAFISIINLIEITKNKWLKD